MLHDTRRRRRAGLFKLIDLDVPHLDVHVVLDNLSVQSPRTRHEMVGAAPRRRRWHLHFTPTWLDMIEGWFSILTRRALANTSFTSTNELAGRIDWWASHGTTTPNPFVWTKTVDDIMTTVERGRVALTESATHQ